MTSNRECYVYITLPEETEFITAGRFRVSQNRNGHPLGEFVYGKRYLERPNAVELDPVELRLKHDRYETVRLQGFFGALRDAMPDYWGRCVIERNAGKTNLDEFDYLMLGPDDRAGALGFGLNIEPPSPRRAFSRTLDLEALQLMAEKIHHHEVEQIDNSTDAKQVHALLLEGTSMGGARPKAVIEDNNHLWIAKFSTAQDRWNQPRVEHAFLNLAKACGLTTADSKLISVANQDVLLVRRFDRDKTDTGYRRHRMVSALTLLRSEENPQARDHWSYLLLADEIRRTSGRPEADLRELFGRMCFNAVVSNLDDHPRNHAVLAKDSNWRLSPAYDLTPTPSVAQDTRLLAMACGTAGRVARQDNLITGHGRFLLSKEEATKIVAHIVTIVRSEWDAHLKRAGVSEKDCAVIASACIYPGFFFDTHR
jgi:serine/threonine-protein kinase HipA